MFGLVQSRCRGLEMCTSQINSLISETSISLWTVATVAVANTFGCWTIVKGLVRNFTFQGLNSHGCSRFTSDKSSLIDSFAMSFCCFLADAVKTIKQRCDKGSCRFWPPTFASRTTHLSENWSLSLWLFLLSWTTPGPLPAPAQLVNCHPPSHVMPRGLVADKCPCFAHIWFHSCWSRDNEGQFWSCWNHVLL